MKPLFAERMGFEPTIRSSRIQTFQVCSFNRSDTSLFCGVQIYFFLPIKRNKNEILLIFT